MLHLANIRRALARHRPEITSEGDSSAPWGAGGESYSARRAAVALVLAGAEDALHLCFIRRAEVAGDRWSGHMALPGGHADPGDADAGATAARETREEVGLPLAGSQRIGALSDIPVRRPGMDVTLVLAGRVFYLGRELLPFEPNHEVAAAYWIPLAHLWEPENATWLELDHGGSRATRAPAARVYPGIRFRDQVIWGLTFRVLTLFSDVLDHPLPHLEDIPEGS